MRKGLGGIGLCCAAMAAFPFTTSTTMAQGAAASATVAQAPAPAPLIAPSLPATFTVDLMTAEGSAAFSARWKNMDARIIEVPAMQGAGAKWKSAYDISPHAGEANFDDTDWPVITPKELEERRGGGKVFFTWYRTLLTMPEKIGNFTTTGAKAVLTVGVDDYAEVWVNGQMPRAAGQPSPGAIQGFNMPNRIVLSESVKPGDKFQIAIFGINGPISVAPLNTVWFRQAKVEFYR